MSRSRRHSKIFSFCQGSDKWSKQKANRKLRRRLSITDLLKAEILPTLRELSDVNMFNKDGKYYNLKAKSKEMRK